jgi:glycine betaine/choline ABC-type transport system substrate-binding protein
MMDIGKIHSRARAVTLPVLAVLVGTVLLGGCGDGFQRLRIGSHDFTEQKLLAEMMALLAEDAGVRVERAIPYGDNRRSLQAIQRGILDAYPECDGSLLSLSGVPRIRDSRMSTVAVRELVAPLGLAWLEPFGLDDSFALAIRRDMAIRRDIERISDLAELPAPLTFAADKGCLARPVDGLYALARRCGLNIGNVELFPVGDRNRICNALADQHVDVAEVFMTDARLEDDGLLALQDDLGFYPVYRPAPLVRQDALERFPALEAAWNQLAGRISTDDMRRLNGRLERQGKDYRDVARRHLEGGLDAARCRRPARRRAAGADPRPAAGRRRGRTDRDDGAESRRVGEAVGGIGFRSRGPRRRRWCQPLAALPLPAPGTHARHHLSAPGPAPQ